MAKADSGSARWEYQYSSVYEDGEAVLRHLDAWATAGWQLVSGSAVQEVEVKTTMRYGAYGDVPDVYSDAVVRHYFYWRRDKLLGDS